MRIGEVFSYVDLDHCALCNRRCGCLHNCKQSKENVQMPSLRAHFQAKAKQLSAAAFELSLGRLRAEMSRMQKQERDAGAYITKRATIRGSSFCV